MRGAKFKYQEFQGRRALTIGGVDPDAEIPGVDDLGIDNFGIDDVGIDDIGIGDVEVDDVGIDDIGPAINAAARVAPVLDAEFAAVCSPIAEDAALRRVLIVDDDVDGAESLGEAIETFNYEVSIAHDSRSARDALRHRRHAVAVIDLRLGRENGLDVLESLKEMSPDLVCIVATGDTDRSSTVAALRRGAYDYLAKPLDPEEVLQALERAGELWRLHDQNARMIEELRAAKEEAERLAMNDALTGLANRKLFGLRLEEAIDSAERLKRYVGVMFVDLDRFKQVNDTHGHQTGDELLKVISDRLLDCARSVDTVARLGGDEFALVLTNLGAPEDINRPGERLIAAIKEPVYVDGMALHVGASVGVSIYPSDTSSPEELIRRADVALYESKAAGRGVIRIYDSEMDARARDQRELEGDLRRALVAQEFQLFYQPQIALADRKVVGCEALIRWRHPSRGLVAPGCFIPAAERSGLILDIGAWTVGEACRQLARWNQELAGPLRVAVNVSLRQLQSGEFVDLVRDNIDAANIDPAQLELELTESLVMDVPERILAHMAQLEQIGVQFAIDDFGTGYSSLSRLKEAHFNRLKIDRSFVNGVADTPADAAICEATVRLARTFKLHSVAEGIETQTQLLRLIELGCDEAQGYLIARPMPADAFANWLDAWARDPDAIMAQDATSP